VWDDKRGCYVRLRSFPLQLADALDPPKRDVTGEVGDALRYALKSLAEARGSIESVLKRMKR
jgi:hypothetical protein